jgi:putative hydrolase of the HAD superfamily
MLKAIFFDLDGTLADDGDSVVAALDAACRTVCRRRPEFDAAHLAFVYRQFSDRAWSDFDTCLRHLSSPAEMLAAVWDQALTSFGVEDPAAANAAAETYWHYRLQHCPPYDDVMPLLQELARRFPLCLLTNGAPGMQRAKCTATGLDPFFRHIFVGGEFTRGKPDPLIFRAALAATQCQPTEAVHIGDSLLHDIAGASNVGIHSVWLNRKGVTREGTESGAVPDFEISSLAQFPDCIERLNRKH